MRLLHCLLLTALALPATAQEAAPHPGKKPKPAPAAARRPAEPVLTFERTPCYGTCPAYSARVFADGRVEYTGQRFVPVLGARTLRLPAAQVTAMLAEARRQHFDQLAARYAGNTSDLPATLVTVRQPGQAAKAVYASENIPANLQAYLGYLQARLDPLAGINVQE